jgi:hypothetical protein
MNRYILGIITLLFFLQPLATKAIAFNAASFPINNISHQQLQSNNQESPHLLIENLLLDAEDEDEFFEQENNSSEDIIVCLPARITYSTLFSKQDAIFYIQDASPANSKPLYILWSVFRI